MRGEGVGGVQQQQNNHQLASTIQKPPQLVYDYTIGDNEENPIPVEVPDVVATSYAQDIDYYQALTLGTPNKRCLAVRLCG